MADNEIQVEAVGAVYAHALVNMAKSQGNLPAVTDDIRGLMDVLNVNPLLVRFAQAVTIPGDEKAKVIGRIFTGRVENLTLHVLQAMARRDRLMFIRGLVEGFEKILSKMANQVEVEVTTAQPLSGDAQERIRAGVAKSLGKEPEMEMNVDASLIGGMKVRVGDTMIDGSVATQLKKIESQLKRLGSMMMQKRFAEMVGET